MEGKRFKRFAYHYHICPWRQSLRLCRQESYWFYLFGKGAALDVCLHPIDDHPLAHLRYNHQHSLGTICFF